MKISTDEFDALVEQAIESIDPAFRGYLDDVPVIVEDRPDEKTCIRMGPGTLNNLLGLFHGVPMNRRSVQGINGPNVIVLYRKNLLSVCRDLETLRDQIRHTLIHELGHYVGFSEEQLRKHLP